MYARVATFDGEPVGDDWGAAPTEAGRSLTLVDPGHGKSVSVALFEDDRVIDRRSGKGLGFMLFESEDAMRRVDEIVSGMGPGTAGPTSSVELYEVVSS